MKRNLSFAKLVVAINCAVPAAILAWDAGQGQLGTNGVNYALRTTGMLALIYLMLSLTVTPLRKLTGYAWLLAFRRTFGLYAFFLAASHFFIFFAFDRDFSVTSTVHEMLTRTYLIIGAVALLLFMPLALTSTDKIIREIGPKRWKALHRLTYVIATCGVLHFYLLVKADHRKPLIFAFVLAALLGYRVVSFGVEYRKKVATAKARKSRQVRRFVGELLVARIVEETHDVRTFRLVSASNGELPFAYQPGQYLNVSLTVDGKKVLRSYTIASSPTRAGYCEISVKREDGGLGSRHLHDNVREGAHIHVSAPAGKFVFTGEDAASVVLLAGGVGITPVMSIVRYLTDRSWDGAIHLIYSARSQRDIVFHEELTDLAGRFPNLHLAVTLTREEGNTWSGARGRIDRKLLETVGPILAVSPAYVCGPTEMIRDAEKLLGDLGVPATKIFSEVFVSPGAKKTGISLPIAPTEVVGEGALASQRLPIDDSDADETLTETPNVHFESSHRDAEASQGMTILEAAEEAGVEIPFECRSGICGQCKTKLTQGRVSMENEDALSEDDRAQGLILACQARPRGDVTVDA